MKAATVSPLRSGNFEISAEVSRHHNGRLLPASPIARAKRDAELVKEHARFVFILHGDKEKRPQFQHNPDYHLNVIAVLAPAEIQGEALPQALVLEIGIGRVTPYRIVEQVKKCFLRIPARRKVRSITDHEVKVLWYGLEPVFCLVTQSLRAGWKNKGATFRGHAHATGAYAFEHGAFFRIELEEELLCALIRERAVASRVHIRKNARLIRKWLKGYSCNYYSEKQLKSFRGVKQAADLWKNLRDIPEWKRALIDKLGDKRALFLEILRAYEFPDPFDQLTKEEERHEALVRKIKALHITTNARSGFHIERERMQHARRHGQNCLTFEHYFEWKYRIAHNL